MGRLLRLHNFIQILFIILLWLYFVLAQTLNREPYYGEIVGVKSIITGNYERARIHKYLGDNNYSVKHMDNPIKEIVKYSEMIELQFEHKNVSICVYIMYNIYIIKKIKERYILTSSSITQYIYIVFE